MDLWNYSKQNYPFNIIRSQFQEILYTDFINYYNQIYFIDFSKSEYGVGFSIIADQIKKKTLSSTKKKKKQAFL